MSRTRAARRLIFKKMASLSSWLLSLAEPGANYVGPAFINDEGGRAAPWRQAIFGVFSSGSGPSEQVGKGVCFAGPAELNA